MAMTLLFVGLLLSAFFAGSETGWYGTNPLKLRHFARTNRRAALLARTLQPSGSFLATLLIGNNLANSLTVQAGVLLAVQWGWQDSEAWTALILTPLVFVFAEVAPKQWMATEPLRRLLWLAPLLAFFRLLLIPLTFPIAALTNRFENDSSTSGRRELAALLKEGGVALPRESQALAAALQALESRGQGLGAFLQREVPCFDTTTSVGDAAKQMAQIPSCLALISRPNQVPGLLLGPSLVHQGAKQLAVAHATSLPELSVDLDLSQAFARLRLEKASFALVRESNCQDSLLDLEYALSLLLASQLPAS